MNSTILDIQSLSFAYPRSKNPVFRDLSLSVSTGQAMCLAGPNGAGKSTLLSLCVGTFRPDKGTVRVSGRPAHDWKAHKELGYVPQHMPFPTLLTVNESLSLVRSYKGWTRDEQAEMIDDLGLAEYLSTQLTQLSGGYKRRVTMALALLGKPRLLVLDEPMVGIDVETKAVILSALSDFQAGGGAILWTTHDLNEVVALDSTLTVMADGQIRFSGPPELPDSGVNRVIVEVISKKEPPPVEHTHVVRTGRKWVYFPAAETDSEAVLRTLHSSGFEDATCRETTVEESYMLFLKSVRKGAES